MAYLVLMGPMMAGKSKLGKRIAKIADREFIDTDKVIVSRHGRIADIFEQQGEAQLRALEKDAVRWALEQEDAVVALGGGAVLAPETQELLRNEQVVLLMMTQESAKRRLALAHERPLLKHGGIDAWVAITEQRLPLYRSLASVEFDTSLGRMEQLAQDIYHWRRTL